MQVCRCPRNALHLADGIDVVIVGMGADDRGNGSPSGSSHDGLGIMSGIHDDTGLVIPDDPDVVVHIPAATIQAELP